jgi:hypothetical protein
MFYLAFREAKKKGGSQSSQSNNPPFDAENYRLVLGFSELSTITASRQQTLEHKSSGRAPIYFASALEDGIRRILERAETVCLVGSQLQDHRMSFVRLY